MRDSFADELTQIAVRDERVMLLVGDLGYRLFDDLAERCPGRFHNMGVSEANMVSVAAGLALGGMRPVTYSIAPFATVRCLEQIRNDVCNMELPVIVVGVGGGYAYGHNGATHHGVDDVAAMRMLPGMTVLCPCDPRETRAALRAAFELDGPVYLRLGRNKEPDLVPDAAAFELGAPTVLREGRSVAILACGPIAGEALKAADRVASSEFQPLVLSAHTVKPIAGIAEFLRRRPLEHLFIVEEHGPCGGLAEALAIELWGLDSRPSLDRIAAPDRYLHQSGTQKYMWGVAGIDAAAIAARVRERLDATVAR